MTRVLVTGATGFIGRHLVDRLLAEEVELVVTSRRPVDDPRFQTCLVDITTPGWADALLAEVAPDSVIHLAGLAIGRNDPALLRPMFDTNTVASVALLTAALDSGVRRVVMAGTLEEVYPGDVPTPTSPYAASKSAVTLHSRLVGEHGLDVVNARIFMTYGPGQDRNKLIPSIVSAYLAGDDLELRASRRQYDWIYVSDVADALAVLALRDATAQAGFRQYDVGTGVMTSVGEVADAVADLLGRERSHVGARLPDPDRRVERRADIVPIEQATGWVPTVELAEGLRSVIDDLQSQAHRA